MKPSSTFKAFGCLVLLTILVSWKKDKSEPAPEENVQLREDASFNNSIVAGLGNVFIQQILQADTKSLLVAKLAFNQDTIAIYGQTGSNSQLEDPHTLVLASNSNRDLLVTEVFNEAMSSRTYMMVNGVKSNIVTEIKHYSADTKELSILDVNHQTGTFQTIWSAVIEGGLLRPVSTGSRSGKIMAVNAGISDVAMCGKPAPTGEIDKELDKVLKYFACGGAALDAHLVTSTIIDAFKGGFAKVKSMNQYLAKLEQIELTEKSMQRQHDFYKNTNDTNWDEVKSTKADLQSDLKEIEKIKDKVPYKDERNLTLEIVNEETALNYDEYTGKKIELSIRAVSLDTADKVSPLIVGIVLTDPESGNKVYQDFGSVKSASGTADFTFDPLMMDDYRKVKGLVARYYFVLNGVEKSYTRAISLRFVGPEEVSALSGSGQSAAPGSKLALPLKVKVVDAKGRPVKDAIVEWVVSSGGGQVDAQQSLSKADGTAEMGWTLGLTGTQLVEAKVKKSDGTLVSGSPVSFFLSVPIAGRWNLVLRSYQDSDGTSEIDDYTGKGSYLELRADSTYSMSYEGEAGTGLYGFINNRMSFTLLTGDDDLTDGESFIVKKLTATELILEDRGSDYVYEIRFRR